MPSLAEIYMKLFFNRVFIFFILLDIYSCKQNETLPIPSTNDTTEILKFAIRTAFDRSRMPSSGSLLKGTLTSPKGGYWGDTILFKIDSFSAKYMPSQIDSFIFKKLTMDEICSLLTNLQLPETPLTLELSRFEKIDSSYDVFLNTYPYSPQFDRAGNHLYIKGKLQGLDTLKCISWGGGGGIYLRITKKGDSLYSQIMGCSSH